MALKSMTGCGRGTASGKGIRVEIELSSVNRKQFDVRVNLPKGLTSLEPRVEKAIQKSISRGNVTGNVSVTISGSALQKCISVEKDTAAAFVRALRATAANLGLKDDLTARCLVTLPGVIRYDSVPSDSEKVWVLLNKALNVAVAGLTAMRIKEGRALQTDISSRFAGLRRDLEKIERAAPGVAERYRRTLLERIEKSGVSNGLNSEQLLKEVALFADRSDISEEIVRLGSHFNQIAGIMKTSEPAGRTLDFLCQEMFREINTIGSKANSGEISAIVVRFKAGLESIREQVQNIE